MVVKLQERLSFWRTALLGGLALGAIFGLIEGFPLFSLAFARDLGTTRGEVSGMYSVYLLCSTLSAPLVGRFVDRYGPGVVAPVGFSVVGMGLVLASRATALWHFYLVYGLVLASATTLVIVAAQVMVSNSYPTEFRGRALGLAYACVGLGDFMMFNLLGQVISGHGWRAAYLVAGVVAFVVTLVFFLLRRRMPGPVRTEESDEAAATVRIGAVLARPAFWLLFAAAVTASVLDFVVFQHLAPFLVTSGYSAASAAFVLGVASLGYVAGQLTAGVASDRWGRERTGVAAGLAYIVLLVGAAQVPAPWLVAVLAAGLGLAVGGVIGARSAGTGDMFAGPFLGRVSGLVQVGSTLGAAAATWLGGFAFDRTGGYGLTFGIAAVAALVWCLAFVAAAPRRGARLGVDGATEPEDRGMAQSTGAIEVRPVTVRDPEVVALIEALDRDLAESEYAENESFGYSTHELEARSVHLVGTSVGDRLVGIGGIELQGGGFAELKRFYVMPGLRGSGLADVILDALERHARDHGTVLLRLETGDRQEAAISFYRRRGFEVIPRFGPYVDSEASVCMQRTLTTDRKRRHRDLPGRASRSGQR